MSLLCCVGEGSIYSKEVESSLLLFKQKDELKNIMRILKGGSAHIVNKLLGRKGKLWAGDYFDKLIRDEEYFSLVYEYIKYNAIKAGLDDAKDRFYCCYE